MLRFPAVLFVLFATLLGLVLAANDLSSSEFSNCQNNATVRINHAFVGFDRNSGSVTFNVSGTSTQEQKVKASLVVLAYGTQVYQRDFDPCDNSTKVAELCPVPKGTFGAAGTQKIPEQYLSQIPSIAFSIPDLEGNATLTLTSAEDGLRIGCIQSGISNGKTLEMPAVSNAAMGIAGSALALTAVSGFVSAGLVGAPPQSVGFSTVLSWFQTIAATGMMSVNYPPIYRSFSKNFGFSTGLVYWRPMQDAIDNFRSRTGGNLTEENAAFLQNATLAFSNGESSTVVQQQRDLSLSLRTLHHTIRDLSFTASNDTNTTSDNQAEHIVHGIGGFAEQLLIPQSNVFMTALLVFGIVLASIALGILLLKLILEFWALYGSFPKRLAGFRRRYWTILAKTIANLILLLYGVWVTWCIFQFSIGDSWTVKIIAAVTLGVFTAILAGFTIRIVVLARRYKKLNGDTSALYENKDTWAKYSVFYDSYKKSKWWIFMPFIFISFLRGAILAAGNGHGLLQTIAQLVVETATFLFLLWNRPFATPQGNWINISIQVVRVLSFVCVLVFVEQLGIAQTTKTITGVILIVVQGVLTALLVILIAVNGLIAMCRENPHRKKRKDAEKLQAAQGDLTSLSPHDSLLARSAPDSRRSSIPSMAQSRHNRVFSAPVVGAAHHSGEFVTSLDRAAHARAKSYTHDRAQRMSMELGRPLDQRRPTFPIL